ncbi:MAG TPA: carboxypeptidase regulatory-like domain-containing protein, partial [Chitinophagaceae bacterium]|nr:carboxypeptidase regulatory-like domain-containing protein [Chitinophagaceae bacterium]
MARITVLVGLFLLSFITIHAQNLSIKGVLQDREDKTLMQGATLKLSLLTGTVTPAPKDTSVRDTSALDSTTPRIIDTVARIQRDTVDKYNIVTGKSGAFQFSDLTPGHYLLTISSVGYETMDREVVLTDSSVDLGTIGVPREAKLLGAVTIKVSPPPVKQKTDTLEYSANAFKVNPDA